MTMPSTKIYPIEKRREWANKYARSSRGREKLKEWVKANPERKAAIHRRHWVNKREFIRQAKSFPCTDCGVQHGYWVMQFDHVPERGKKKFGVNSLAGLRASLDAIIEEISKCDVVCANCHAERTYARNKAKVA